MPKNKGKGGKGKRKGKNKNAEQIKRELVFKTVDQDYAQVCRILGDCRVMVYTFDGKERVAKIRGSFKKRVWIREGDVVLVGLRSFEDDKCDIIHRYHPDEVRKLRARGHVPAKLPMDEQEEDNADIVDFTDSSESDDNDDIEIDDL